jgi:FPC/CPF motif-containing protein YcgG
MNEQLCGESFREKALRFSEWVLDSEFPCVGAKAAFNSDAHSFHLYDQLADPASTALLASDLQRFTASQLRQESEYATFIAVFRGPVVQSELEFEQRLWSQLAMLHNIDARSWDSAVRSDPADPHFSFSFAGQALYVIGLHAHSSRLARRFPWPTLVFNPHEQFERLRADGKWKRMQQTIRGRDMQLQGSVNPMLSDFGESSEARQYSGRAVESDWRPPIGNGKCPFAH